MGPPIDPKVFNYNNFGVYTTGAYVSAERSKSIFFILDIKIKQSNEQTVIMRRSQC